jgi:hypothetical protein
LGASKDHQHAGAIGRGATNREQFAAGSLNYLFCRFVAIGCWIFHDVVEGLWRILCRKTEMHSDFFP